MDVDVYDLGSHSGRKGADTFCESSYIMSPPITSIFLRVE